MELDAEDEVVTAAHVLPFSALVGQHHLKLALEMLAVNPRLGGVLIRGEKGTAKSTAARGLAELLPAVDVVVGCCYGCSICRPATWCADCKQRQDLQTATRRPSFVTLPLGITEDQLLGTMDLEHALTQGQRRFSPGLLAQVNQGVLYVDEVNLLDDHIVDLLLDVAAMGVNIVAREGVSISHPAELMLVGTMNPEEGELRPQLLDRFGLCAEVRGLDDPQARAEVVMRRLAFEADPEAFCARYEAEQKAVGERIVSARAMLAQIQPERRWCLAAAELSLELGADGHRADVLLVKAAATLAALAGRSAICAEDLQRAATVVLPHRIRQGALEPRPTEVHQETERLNARIKQVVERVAESSEEKAKKKKALSAEQQIDRSAIHRPCQADDGEAAAVKPQKAPSNDSGLFAAGLWGQGDDLVEPDTAVEPDDERLPVRSSPARTGRRRRSRRLPSATPFRGRHVGAVAATQRQGHLRDVAWEATMRRVAPLQPRRAAGSTLAINIRRAELLEKRRVTPPEELLLFVVDTSGSMGGKLTRLAKQMATELLRDAYLTRACVSMIAFRELAAELLMGSTRKVGRVHQTLDALPCGGTTPLASGLALAYRTLRQQHRHSGHPQATMILLSDGRANVGSRPGYEGVLAEVEQQATKIASLSDVGVILIDTTEDGKNDQAARRLEDWLGARRIALAPMSRRGRDPIRVLRAAVSAPQRAH